MPFESPTKSTIEDILNISDERVLALRGASLSPSLLDFAGLIRADEQNFIIPDAVVMHDGQPFVYLVDHRNVKSITETQLQHSLQRLALRDDAPYLALTRPGIVQIYALGELDDNYSPVLEADRLDPGLLARLIVGSLPKHAIKGVSGAHKLMLNLLNAVTDHLIDGRGLQPAEALSLVGRALFMRFLGDRKILPAEAPFKGVTSLERCFETPEAAASTCRWLDATFNGDLLELPSGGGSTYFSILHNSSRGSALVDLSAIMRGDSPLGEGFYQGQLRWGDLHFAHIPAGLLSQVYEVFSHRFDQKAAKKNSIYYTPRHLAEYMVGTALNMLGDQAHKARVLDPASGGGVFLLSAFRYMVKARWQQTGIQPSTPDIRQILNEQLVGFDISPAARQLTALAMYLTALELDPNTSTLQNLKFKPLQGTTLIAAEEFEASKSDVRLGSLSPHAIRKYHSKFDVVIGNPPWTALSNEPLRKAFTNLTHECMIKRGVESVANPDGVPDLPFVWAATRWAKPDGILAFALHGRLLNKVSPAGHAARTQLFRGLDVQYILNGIELRQTEVWPNMGAPFCLLFARNRLSSKNSEFQAVTPLVDDSINRIGRMRIDSKDAWLSDVSMVAKIPWLFKTLAKGNALDIELLEKISNLPYPTLGTNMKKTPSSHGYQTLQKNIEGVLSLFLSYLPTMPKAPEACWWLAPTDNFKPFEYDVVHRRREHEIYKAPLTLLREAPSALSGRPLGILALKDVAYSRSYIGFSFHGQPDAQLRATYLTVIFNSPLFLYFILMTSSKLGCERNTLQKIEIEKFPIYPFDMLSTTQIELLKEIEHNIHNNDKNNNRDMMAQLFIRDIYSLRLADLTLIEDRLAYSMPFLSSQKRAILEPRPSETQAFHEALTNGLTSFDMSHSPIQIDLLEPSIVSPWRFLRIGDPSNKPCLSIKELLSAVAVADMLDASRVEVLRKDELYLGILNQGRFWTRTAARTLALDIVQRNHPILSRGVE